MVFRKPYAFLIKNFRKIHIVLFVLCAFVFYKCLNLSNFMKEFINYLSYDPYVEPITKHTSILAYISLIVIIFITVTLIILLKKKNKPWKLYLIPLISYTLTLIVFISTQSYFSSYSGEIVSSVAITLNGFLLVARIPQYAVFLILLIRILGLDLNKFSFKTDKEFLELDQEDRDEFEVNINIDKYAFERLYRKTIRTLNYFYEEHKYIVKVSIVIIMAIIIFGIVKYSFSHRTINETGTLNANNYEITVNNSYYTNKDKKGNVLEKNSSFVVLNLTVKNNGPKRKLNVDNFHIVNGKKDYTFTGSTYVNEFVDMGSKYNLSEFRNGESRTFAMAFKVDKKLEKNRFVLYYQEYKSGQVVYLRKLKLNIKDLTRINVNDEKRLGKELKVQYPDGSIKKFTLENATVENPIDYNIEKCDADSNCSINTEQYSAKSNKQVLKIEFSSSDYEGKQLIDFSTNYGKIKYIDNGGYTRVIDVKNVLGDKEYLGNYLYIEVPNDVKDSNKIYVIYNLRNQKYLYKIR